MSDELNLHPGSTVVPDSIRTNKVFTEQTDTKDIILNGQSLTGVTHDPDNGDYTQIPSSLALQLIRAELENKFKDLGFKFDTIYFDPVLTDPIIDEYFYGSDWEKSDDIIFDASEAIYKNYKSPQMDQAILRIPSSVINKIGKYFFKVIVRELPSGSIIVTNEKQQRVAIITDPGTYQFEATVDNTTTGFFQIAINNMQEQDTCVISLFSVHHIKNIFDSYMDYKVSEYMLGDMKNKIQELQDYVKNNIREMQEIVNTAIENFNTAMFTHRTDFNNPHRVSYSQLLNTYSNIVALSNEDTNEIVLEHSPEPDVHLNKETYKSLPLW